jgi:hypothetical protein
MTAFGDDVDEKVLSLGIQFSVPILRDGLAILVRTKKNSRRWFAMFEIFEWQIWPILAVTGFCVGAVVYVLNLLEALTLPNMPQRYVPRDVPNDQSSNESTGLQKGSNDKGPTSEPWTECHPNNLLDQETASRRNSLLKSQPTLDHWTASATSDQDRAIGRSLDLGGAPVQPSLSPPPAPFPNLNQERASNIQTPTKTLPPLNPGMAPPPAPPLPPPSAPPPNFDQQTTPETNHFTESLPQLEQNTAGAPTGLDQDKADRTDPVQDFGDSIWNSMGILVGVSTPEGLNIAARLVIAAYGLLVVIMLALFTANTAAAVTTNFLVSEINGQVNKHTKGKSNLPKRDECSSVVNPSMLLHISWKPLLHKSPYFIFGFFL